MERDAAAAASSVILYSRIDVPQLLNISHSYDDLVTLLSFILTAPSTIDRYGRDERWIPKAVRDLLIAHKASGSVE